MSSGHGAGANVVPEAGFGVGSVQSGAAPLAFGLVRDVEAGCRTLVRLRKAGHSRYQNARAALHAAPDGEACGDVIPTASTATSTTCWEALATVRASGRNPLLPAALDRLRQLIPEVAEAPPPDWDANVHHPDRGRSVWLRFGHTGRGRERLVHQ
jgi:hypothetical protein